nr:hypothetical protein [uncultured Desulfuromonas sp.]
MPTTQTFFNAQSSQPYIPLTGQEITRIRRRSLLRSFVSLLGALLPVLGFCVVAVLAPMMFGQPLWHGIFLLMAMVLVGDMILGRRQIGWLRRNLTMMLTGAAGYFITMPWHSEILPSSWSSVDVQATAASFFLIGGVLFLLLIQKLAQIGIQNAQRAFLFKKDDMSPQKLHEDLNQQGVTAFDPFFDALAESGRPYMTRAEVLAIVTVLNQLRARMEHEKNRQ